MESAGKSGNKKKKQAAYGLGKSGEEAACLYLKRKKYKILKTGFRFHRAEIDIIATDKKNLVFIEVKTRMDKRYGSPEESVNPQKQKQMKKIAEAFLALNNIEDTPCRFDVISIAGHPKTGYSLVHFKDAF
jgi:putative endonuclease